MVGSGSGAARRLAKRGRAMKVCVGHDYMDTLRAARRRKHADKQTRLMNELRAMLLEMKAALKQDFAGATAQGAKTRGRRR
ncbi:MAG: hypothetical protein B7Y80_01955 [Hyphomicrobium sp. 32-62-53]|nr:MAG: hypothetical protein B7Z29_02305 [Hyphomicrobium sp. 12-62-95]OYY01512.1 MAG: hypothetical protein B7Y80_01955 [Hyphomicrobium sp. 32-62-53]